MDLVVLNNITNLDLVVTEGDQVEIVLISESELILEINSQVPGGSGGSGSVTSTEYISLVNRVSTNSAQMISADNAISNAVSVLSTIVSNTVSNLGVLSLAVSVISTALSAEVVNRVSADNALSNAVSVVSSQVTSNSAQMTSADNAISNAVSIVSAAQAVTSAAVTSVNNRISGVSADLTSFKASINNFGDVSTSSPVSAQVLRYVSATGQWVNQTMAGGSGSVTSANFVSLRSVVQANSAQMTSADNAISNAVSIVSAAVVQEASVRSVQAISIMSAVSVNSAQMTSADNAISNAVSIVSTAQAVTSAAVTSVNNRISTVSADLTSFKASLDNFGDVSVSGVTDGQVLMWRSASAQWIASTAAGGTASVTSAEYLSLVDRVSGNSTQMTSANNAISNAVSIVSVAVVQEASVRSVQAVSIMSAVSVNSAQMTSADNAISNAVSIVSAAQAVTSAAVTSVNQIVSVISQQVSVMSVQVASVASVVHANSAQMVSADNAISNAVSVVSAQVVTNSAQMTSANNAISAAVVNKTISTLVGVSLAPADLQVLTWNSANAQWVASTITAGVGSVTSTELSAVSAAAASANATLSAAVTPIRRVLSANASAVAATLANVSGLSITVSAGGLYQFRAYLMVNRPNASNGCGYGMTFPAMTTIRGNITTNILSGLVSIWTFDGDSASGSTIASTGSIAALNVVVDIDGIMLASANGIVQVQAKTSATTSAPLVFLTGSYIQALRIN